MGCISGETAARNIFDTSVHARTMRDAMRIFRLERPDWRIHKIGKVPRRESNPDVTKPLMAMPSAHT